MRIKEVLIVLAMFVASLTYGQIKIGDNPQNINASSVLELESTSRAFVITRVNSTQMNAITPLEGAMVYNTDSQCIHYYDSTQWLNLCDALTNISLIDNGDGTYTFSDANNVETDINTLNESLTINNGDLILTDTAGNQISVALTSLNTQTFTTNPVINAFSTMVITEDASGTNFNFEVGIIDGENIQDGSIRQRDLAGASVGSVQLRDNSVRNIAMADESVGSLEIINGSIQPIDILPGNNNQILTTNGSGLVSWADRAGLVTASEITYNNATSLLAATNVQTAIDELNNNIETINVFDEGDGRITFTDEDGLTIKIDKADITANPDGTYIFTNNDGSDVIIDTNGTTFSNLLTGNRIATVSEADGSSVEINETITDITGTLATGKPIATYNNENGTSVIINETVTNISDTGDGTITFTNENGVSQKVNKSNVIDNSNGTYTFTNNDGIDEIIDTRAISNPYTPSSGLTATNVQGAIDEVAASNAADLDSDPTNELSDVAISGTTIGLTNPAAGATGVDLDLTFATDTELAALNTDDADADPTNELSDVAISGTTIGLTNPAAGATGVDLDLTFATDTELAALNTDDADADPTNELSDVAISGTTIGLTNPAAGATGVDLDLTFATDTELAALNTDDADANPTNEIQILTKTGSTITLSNGGGTVEETNTSLTQNTSSGVVTYTREDATNQNVNVISSNANNSITAGTDGGAFYNDADASSNNEIQNINQVLTEGNDAGGLLIKNIGPPVDGTDVATKNYVDNAITSSNSLTDSNIFVGDVTNTAQAVAVSGDATIDNTGSLTIAPDAVTTTKIANANVSPIKIEPSATNGQVLKTQGGTVTWAEPAVVAMGKVDEFATISQRTNGASATRNSSGNYTVTFTSPRATPDYIIQLTLLNAGPSVSIEVASQSINSFVVQISQISYDNTIPDLAFNPFDASWYFTVTDF